MEAADQAAQMDEFTKANQTLIASLQQDNKNLRAEVAKKEEDLHVATQEIARMSADGSSASEKFLIASLTSARESITGLDLANQELLEAIESAQDEISRLSTAGMDLNSKYSRLSTLYKDLEIERDQMGIAMDELLSNGGDEVDVLRTQIQDKDTLIAQLQDDMKMSASGFDQRIDQLEQSVNQWKSQVQDGEALIESLRNDLEKCRVECANSQSQYIQDVGVKDKEIAALKAMIQDLEFKATTEESQSKVDHDLTSLSLAKMTADLQTCRCDLEEATTDCEYFKSELSEKSSTIRDLELRLERSEDDMRSKEKERFDVENRLKSLAASHEALVAEMNQMRAEADGTNSQLDELNEVIEGLESELKGANKKCASTLKDLEGVTCERDDLRTILDASNQSYDKSQSEIQNLRMELTAAQSYYDLSKAEVGRCEQTLTKLQVDYDTTCKLLSTEKLRCSSRDDEIVELQRSLTKALEDLNNVSEEQANKFVISSNKMSSLSEEASKYKQQEGALSSEIESKSQEIDALMTTLKGKQDEMESKDESMSLLTQQVNEYVNDKIPQLDLEIERRKKTNETLSAEVDELNEVMEGLESEITELKQELAMSKANLANLDEINLKYKSASEALKTGQEETKDLKLRISELEREHDISSNHSSQLERDLLKAQDKIQVQDSNIKMISVELNDVRAELENNKLVFSQLQSSDQEVQLQNKQNAREIENLSNKLAAADSLSSTLKTDLQSSNDKIKDLEKNVGSLQVEVIKSEKTAQGAVAELKLFQKDFDIQADLLKQSQATISSLTTNFSKIPSHVCTCDLRGQLDKKLEALSSSEVKLSSMREELYESKTTIEIRDKDILQLQGRLDCYGGDNLSLEQTITSLRGKVSTLEGDVRDLTYQLGRSEDETRRCTAELEVYKGRISACNLQIENLNEEVAQWKIWEAESETRDAVDKGLLMTAQNDAGKSNAKCNSLEEHIDSLYKKIEGNEAELRRALDKETQLISQMRGSEIELNVLEGKYNDLNEKFANLQAEFDSLKKQNTTYYNGSLEKDSALASLKQELQAMQNKLELYEFTGEISNSLQKRVGDSVNSLTNELEKCKYERDQYQSQSSQLDDVQRLLKGAEDCLSIRDAEIKALVDELDDLKLKISELDKSLDLSKHHESLLENSIASKNSTIDDLTKQVHSLQAELKLKLADLAFSNISLTNATENFKTSEVALNQSKDENLAIERSKKEIEIENDSLKRQLALVNTDLHHTQSKCGKFDDGLSVAQTQLLEMETELRKLRIMLSEKENECVDNSADFARRLSAAEERALRCSADLADVRALLVATSKELQNKTIEMETLLASASDTSIRDLEAQIDELKRENDELKGELALSQTQSGETKSARDEIAKLRRELGVMKEVVRKTSDKMKEKDRLYAEMKAKYDSLLANHEGCGKRIDDLRKQLNDAVQENEALRKENGSLKNKLDKGIIELANSERKNSQQADEEERRRREKLRKRAEEEREKNEAARNRALKEAQAAAEAAKKLQETQERERAAAAAEAAKKLAAVSPELKPPEKHEVPMPTPKMKGIDDHGKEVDIPHVLNIKIVGAEDLNNSNVFGYPTPDAYVLVNALKKTATSKKRAKSNPCHSTAKTGIIKQSYNPQWHEDIRATIVGSGYLILNVFSFSVIAGDTFLGQAVIDLDEHIEIYHEQSLKLSLPISKAKHPVYSHDGAAMSLLPVQGKGKITVEVSIPSVFSNMCGWFTDVRLGWNADIVGVKMWVELVEGVINCYESPYGGVLHNTIDCKRVSDIEEIMYDKLEINIEAIKITLMNLDPNLPPAEVIWGWADDRNRLKKLWRRALIHNHGSGVVSTKTASAISTGDKMLKEEDDHHAQNATTPTTTAEESTTSGPTTDILKESRGAEATPSMTKSKVDKNPRIVRTPR